MNRFVEPQLAPLSSVVCIKTLLISILGTLIVCLSAQSSLAAETTKSTDAKPPKTISSQPFEYQLENRPDPFIPFISEKAAVTANMDEIVDINGPLTGMQLFEPGQLTLVALVQNGPDHLAMVQDTTGKGYVLNEGLKIGRRGVVKTIAQNSVRIEETTVTRGGKKTVTEVVMLLKKEGEE